MAIGRISGPLLKDNLLRQGVDLAFETDLLYLDVTNSRVGIRTASPTHDLTIDGTTRTTNLEVLNRVDIGTDGILSLHDNIIESSGDITLSPSADEPVIINSKLSIDAIQIDGNTISTVISNSPLEFKPNGTGTVEIYSNTTVNGNFHTTGNITADGDIQIGDENTDNIVFNAKIDSDIIPNQDNFFNLGDENYRWANVWTDNLITNTISTGDLVVDAINLGLTQGNTIYVAKNGDDTNAGLHQNDPVASIQYALSLASSGDIVYVYPGTYTEIFPLTIPVGVTIRGAGLRAVIIQPTALTNSNDAFVLNGETTIEDLTVANFYYNSVSDTGYAFKFANPLTVTSKSPYIRNTSVITRGSVITQDDPLGFNTGDAGRGAYLDGSYATSNSKEASCLFHSVTMICPNADILVMTNGVRVEWLNSFGYYGNKNFNAISGSSGFAGNGSTILRVSGTSGTFNVGDTLTYYDTDGITELASGVINRFDTDKIWLTGKQLGFITAQEASEKLISVYGGAQLSTTQKKFGSSSLLLNGTDSYLTLASSTDFAFGTDDFTLEAWFYPSSYPTAALIFDFRTSTSQAVPVMGVLATGEPYLYVNGSIVIQGSAGSVTTGQWHHIAISRVSGNTRLFLNGQQVGSTWTDATDYIAAPLHIGANFGHTSFINGYLDELEIVNGTGKYSGTFPVPVSPIIRSSDTVFLSHLDGTNGSTEIVEELLIFQDIRTDNSASANYIDLVDYTDFGVEVRSIGSASIYGNYGAYGDGDGVILYLIGHNFAYVGAGGSSDNDITTVIQENEVVELNNAKIHYTSVDQNGDYRVGDLFHVNQKDGTVEFTSANININTTTGITFVDGSNQTIIDPTKIETGNIRISGNTVESLIGNLDIDSASNTINFLDNVTINGDLDVTGDVTIGGNIVLGDQSTDTITVLAKINSDLIPNYNNTFTLGTDELRWDQVYSSALNVGSIRIDTNVIQTIDSNANLELIASGTGKIYVPSSDVEVTNNLTISGTSTLQDLDITGTLTHVGGINQTGNVTQTGTYELTGNLTVTDVTQFENIQINDNYITTTDSNSNLELLANASGIVSIPSNDVEVTQDLTVLGNTTVNALIVNQTLTASEITTGDISISDNYITTTLSNSNLELYANGTGIVVIPSNDVEVTQNITVNGNTTLANVFITGNVSQIGDVNQTGDVTQTGNYSLTGILTISDAAQFENIRIDGNTISTTLSNSDLELLAHGTGKISVPSNNVEITQDLTVIGTTSVSNINVNQTTTANEFFTGDISISDNYITTTLSNSNLELYANGTGNIYVPSNNVEITQDLLVNGTSDFSNTNITGNVIQTGDYTQTGDTSQTGNYDLTGSLTVSSFGQFENVRIDGNTVATTLSNSDLELYANGSGIVSIPSNDLQITQDLTVLGTAYLNNLAISATATVNRVSTGNILIDDNYITTTLSNSDLQLYANGTGKIYIPDNDAQVDNTFTVLGDTSLTNVTISGDVTQTGNYTQTGTFIQTGSFISSGTLTVGSTAQFENIQINDNYITTTDSNSNLELRASGSGIIYIPQNDVNIVGDLLVQGSITSTNYSNTQSITTNEFTTGNIVINDNYIETTLSNSNLELRANGTGNIVINDYTINENVISTTTNQDIIFSTSGTGKIQIDSTQSLVIPVGPTSDRPSPASSGMIRFNTTINHYEGYDGFNWVILDGVYDSDLNTYITAEASYGANDNTIRFYTNGTQVADLTSQRLSVNQIDVDNININGNVISSPANTDIILAANGTGKIKISNFEIYDNTIKNISLDAVTTIAQTGGGYFKVEGTNGFVIPSGETYQRPLAQVMGMTRYNTQLKQVEVFDGQDWVSSAGTFGGINQATANDIAIVTALVLG